MEQKLTEVIKYKMQEMGKIMSTKSIINNASSSGKPNKCSSYDEQTGRCKQTNKYCDTCYGNSLKAIK